MSWIAFVAWWRSAAVAAAPFVAAFVAGCAYEACSVLWVHAATSGAPGRAALWSGIQATMLVLGVGESVRDKRAAALFVVGYAVGAYEAVLRG